MGKGLKTSRAKSPERAFNVLSGLAYELAERKLRDGTATSQLICEILKRDSEKYKLENEKLRMDVEVANAKIKQMEESTASGELYAKAIEAFQKYSGQEIIDDIYWDEED